MFGTTGNLLSARYVTLKRKKPVNLATAPHCKLGDNIFLTDPVPIPCGSCVGCRMDKAKSWKDRCVIESQKYKDRCWFLTLTYDDAHLPINEFGEPFVKKRDFQLFMKRLRKYSGHSFRYFACSEYGEKGHRPHFHAILFGDLTGFEVIAPFRYRCKYISDAWDLGLHEVSPATPECMAYVAGYVEKKQKDQDWDSYPVKPFLLMSRKPGIGLSEIPSVGLVDRKVYGNFGSSKHAPVPAQLIRKCKDQPWYEQYKKDGEQIARSMSKNNFGVYHSWNEEEVGFIQDGYSNDMLKTKRKAKL